MRMKNSLLFCTLAAGLIACSDQTEMASASSKAPAPAPATAPAAPAAAGVLTGTAVEVVEAGEYTYVKVRTASGEEWAAVPKAPIKKGERVSIAAQMTMENFESKTLGRTFERVVFGNMGNGPSGMAPAGEMPAGHPPTGAGNTAMGGPKQHMSGGAADIDVNVPKAEGAGAYTVAEVWSAKASIKDKPVVVRGKVVKFNGGIMGKNWVHVRDGSGSADKGDNDLTVTTSDVAAVGDVVLVKGVLRVEKDFGAGYLYPVIVEDASVKK